MVWDGVLWPHKAMITMMKLFRRALEEVSRTRRDVTTYRNRRDRYTAKQCFRECRQFGSYVYS